jgi:hypothetical protein
MRIRAAIRGVLRSEDGVALVLGLITVVVMLLITTALVVAAVTETLSAQVHEDSGRALNVAEAGGAHAIGLALRGDTNWAVNAGATAGDCGVMPGTDWLVLRDPTRGCLRDIPYPNTTPIQVTPVTGGGVPGLACGSVTVEAPTGGGTALPEDQRIGTYTVAFHPTQDRDTGRITIRVTGTVGRATRGIQFVAQRVTPAAFVAYSASSVDATVRSGSGTMNIHGSVYIRGDWAFKGNAGQYNDRPVTTADAASSPFENQTFVCNNLELVGSAEIGQPTQPMRAVHIAGSAVRRGGGDISLRIHANRRTNVVPDIGLGDVERLTRCIKGVEVPGSPGTPPILPIDEANCNAEFGQGMWNRYTNHLDGGQARRIRPRASPEPPTPLWVSENVPSPLVFGSTQSFALPKRGQEDTCRAALTDNLPLTGTPATDRLRLQAILAVCSLYYDAANQVKYVAGGQVIYLHGRMEVNVAIRYRVDNDPLAPAAEQTERDTSVVVVACEEGCANQESVHFRRVGDDRGQFVAWNRGSQNLRFAETDLLAFLVNGITRLEGRGNASTNCADPSAQEVNAVFVTGGTPGETFTKFRLQLFGGLISRQLVLQDDGTGPGQSFNVRWCQIPDLGELVGATLLGQFLNDPRNSTVIMQNWREVGF